MTTDLRAIQSATSEFHDELVQFVFRSSAAPGLLQHAREMLHTAPRELAESFEQAVRGAGLVE